MIDKGETRDYATYCTWPKVQAVAHVDTAGHSPHNSLSAPRKGQRAEQPAAGTSWRVAAIDKLQLTEAILREFPSRS